MKNACQKTVFVLSMVMITYVAYFVYIGYYNHIVGTIHSEAYRESVITSLFSMQLPLLIASGVQWLADRFKIKTYSFWSLVVLLVSISLTLTPLITRLSKVLPSR